MLARGNKFASAIDTGCVGRMLFLGCRAQFRLSVNAGYRITDRLYTSASWANLPNTGLCDDNEGLNALGLRVGWRRQTRFIRQYAGR